MKFAHNKDARLFACKKQGRFFRPLLALLAFGIMSGCAVTPSKTTNISKASSHNASVGLRSEQGAPHSAYIKQNPVVYPDLWSEVRSLMGKEVDQNNPRIDYYVQWFTRHPAYFEKLLDRSRPYLYYIMREVKKRHIPSEFALVPVVESAFDPFAYSNGLASGLWQITPATGRYYEVSQNWWFDGRRDVITATTFALDYFKELYTTFNSWELALAAYNAGNGTVGRAIQYNLKKNLPISYWDLKLPSQTENYVPKLLAVAKIIKNPHLYKINIKPIANKPFFEVVDIGSQLDLKRAATLADISLKDLRQLNPGFNRWATDPEGPNRLLIPVKNVGQFKKALKQVPDSERLNWQRYTIHSGDTLKSIALAFKTSVDVIKKINRLANNTIYVGEALLIPQPVDDSKILSHKQKALALLQSKNILSDNKGRVRHYYTVKKGDTPWLIARQHQIPLNQVLRWNSLMGKSQIHPGQKLLLWIGHDNIVRHIYKVKGGDSLWTIARQHKTSVDQLLEWNNLEPDAILRPNQKLAIWSAPSASAFKKHASRANNGIIRKVYYTVRKGESIGKIADRFQVEKAQISTWNTLKTNYLQPGQKLTLFVDVTEAR